MSGGGPWAREKRKLPLPGRCAASYALHTPLVLALGRMHARHGRPHLRQHNKVAQIGNTTGSTSGSIVDSTPGSAERISHRGRQHKWLHGWQQGGCSVPVR